MGQEIEEGLDWVVLAPAVSIFAMRWSWNSKGLEHLGPSREPFSSCNLSFLYVVSIHELVWASLQHSRLMVVEVVKREHSSWWDRNYIAFCDPHSVSLPPHSVGCKQVTSPTHIQKDRRHTLSLDKNNVKVTVWRSTCDGRYCCGHLWNIHTAMLALNS